MAQWKKLLWNVPYNGLSVVLNATTDEMKIDYAEKRPLEIDAILGNPLRIAQKFSSAASSMTMLYQQLCFLDAANTVSE